MKLAVGVVIQTGRKVLMLQRAEGHLKGLWCTPGGTVEDGEGFETAAIRETREETGIICQKLLLLGVTHVRKEDGSDLHCVFFRATKWMGLPRNMEEKKHSQIRWFQQSHVPSGLTPTTRQFVVKYPQLWAPSAEQLRALDQMQFGKSNLESLARIK